MLKKAYSTRLEILDAIEELKARWPAHSIKPSMVIELEELEDLLANFTEKKPEDRNE